MVGGDCEYARCEADVPGRTMLTASPITGVFGGRKAARRKISRRAAILSGETMTVRFGITMFSPTVAFCCSRWRFRAHLGPSTLSHSVWLPKKAVSRLKKKKFCSRLPAHCPSHLASSRQTPHLPWPVVTRGMRMPLITRLPVNSAAACISLSSISALGCKRRGGLRPGCGRGSRRLAREGARRCCGCSGGDMATGALKWAEMRS